MGDRALRHATVGDFQCATNSGRWSDLSNATGGRVGVPELAGVGTLRPGDDVGIILNGALPGAPAALVLGRSTLYAPILGITLVPSPTGSLADPAIPMNGGRVYNFTWPLGSELVLQYLVVDPGGPQGVAASNGVVGRS